jgi:hypothetical protein
LRGYLGAMSRTLTVVLTGVVSGILVVTAARMLLATLDRDLAGDTDSPQLALVLAAAAAAMAIAGLAVATARPWSRGLSLVVGLAAVIAGIGGLIYFLLASLLVAGMFPELLLEPGNLTIALVTGLTGLTGIGLLMRRSAPEATAGAASPWPARAWHPVAAGIAIGIAAAWVWGAFIWPLIPSECCLL